MTLAWERRPLVTGPRRLGTAPGNCAVLAPRLIGGSVAVGVAIGRRVRRRYRGDVRDRLAARPVAAVRPAFTVGPPLAGWPARVQVRRGAAIGIGAPLARPACARTLGIDHSPVTPAD